jgi:hypothetical protein
MWKSDLSGELVEIRESTSRGVLRVKGVKHDVSVRGVFFGTRFERMMGRGGEGELKKGGVRAVLRWWEGIIIFCVPQSANALPTKPTGEVASMGETHGRVLRGRYAPQHMQSLHLIVSLFFGNATRWQ